MSRKVKESLKSYPSAGEASEEGLSYFFRFPTWRRELSRKVKKWLKSYPSAARVVKMDFRTFCLFLHGDWG